jgi:hypothetical protein
MELLPTPEPPDAIDASTVIIVPVLEITNEQNAVQAITVLIPHQPMVPAIHHEQTAVQAITVPAPQN